MRIIKIRTWLQPSVNGIAAILIGSVGSIAAAGSAALADPTSLTLNKWLPECPADDRLDPYATWAHVRGDDGAKIFLKEEHAKLGTARFAYWLNCQGFNVFVSEPVIFKRLKPGEIVINAAFKLGSRQKMLYKRWLFSNPYWQETFTIIVGQSGHISSIQHTMDSK